MIKPSGENTTTSKLKILLIVSVCACLVSAGVLTFLIVWSSGQVSNEQNSEDSNLVISEKQQSAQPKISKQQKVDAALSKLKISTDLRPSLAHGPKTSQHQKYIVLHDTEGDGSASGVVNYWDRNGSGTGAQFVINKDGSIVQCVNIDEIAHHAGFGDTGHNTSFGVVEDGRDDRRGTVPIGSWASDYGMNSWSIGIEIVHVGGSGPYPEAQLLALDNLIAYIDAYYSDSPAGNGGKIIDHKMWRTGNSDTSKEFAPYLANYQSSRHH